MVLTRFSFTGDRAVRERLRRLSRFVAGVDDAMYKAIGQEGIKGIRRNFQHRVDPETGRKWTPLKWRKSVRILDDTGTLKRSIKWLVRARRVVFYTDYKSAAVHNFGATIYPKRGPFLVFRAPVGARNGVGPLVRARKVVIPQRRFMGLTWQTQTLIVQRLERLALRIAERK